METCSECGKQLKTRGALGAHMRFAHGIRQHSKPMLTCAQCGATFQRGSVAQEADHKLHYCCTEHRRVYEKEHPKKGNLSATWKGGLVMVPCAECGTMLERYPSQLRKSGGIAVCPRPSSCSREHHRKAVSGTRGGKVDVPCNRCGKLVTRWTKQYEVEQKAFCRECRYKHHSDTITGKQYPRGENHWRWCGGKPDDRDAWFLEEGRKWWRARRQADKHTCQICGQAFGARGNGLSVHHKLGFTAFPSVRSHVGNGICVCKKCHSWVHSNAGREQREAWEKEALAELGHLLTDEERERIAEAVRNHQPTLQEVAQ